MPLVDPATDHDAYRFDQFITDHCEFFNGYELRTMMRARVMVPVPPERWWSRILPVLETSDNHRRRMGHPILVGNCFRPNPFNRQVGGALWSPHLFFRGIDLDLPRGHQSQENQEKHYRVACEAWLTTEDLGLGLYRPWRGIRVHYDRGRSWRPHRYWKKQYVRPILDSLR